VPPAGLAREPYTMLPRRAQGAPGTELMLTRNRDSSWRADYGARQLVCQVLKCAQTAESDLGLRAFTGAQLHAMRELHGKVGNQLRTEAVSPTCFCTEHRSAAAELLGELLAEIPAPQNSTEFRVGRIESIDLGTSTRTKPAIVPADDEPANLEAAAQPRQVAFAARFSSDAVRYTVRWYGYGDGYGGSGAQWLDGEPPPIGAASSSLEISEVKRGILMYAGLAAYYEHCASVKAWRLDVGELGRYAKRNTRVLGFRVLDFFYSNPLSLLARAGILAFRLLVVAVAGICFWSLWISFDRSDLHLSAILSAGAISVLSCSLSMFEISSHLQNVHSPELQTYVVRILFIVPVFTVDCWISLRYANTEHHNWTVYMTAARDVYEAFVIHTFFLFLTACFGGVDGKANLCRVLASKPQVQHLFGLRHVLRVPRMGEPFLLFCTHGTLQFVVVKTVCSVTEAVLHSTGVHTPSRTFSPHFPFLYMTIAINMSQIVALYCLMLFYHALHHDLSPIRPLGKFLSVKLIVFFTFWQSIAISVAVRAGLIHSTGHWGARQVSSALNNYLLCIEMLVAAVLHTYVFAHRDFVGPQLIQETRMLRRWDSMMVDVVDPRKIFIDTACMFYFLLTCGCCRVRSDSQDLPELRSRAASKLDDKPFRSPSGSSRRSSFAAAGRSASHNDVTGQVPLLNLF